MRVLVAHVRYRQRGGEEAVVAHEAELLQRAGHEVSRLDVHSEEFDRLPLATKASIAAFPDHEHGRSLVRAAIAETRADVVHFHNLFPLLGAGAVSEARRLGVGVVQTLHNYRVSCAAGTHRRDDRTCRLCRPAWWAPSAVLGCYRGSRLQSACMGRATERLWRDFVGDRGAHVWLALTEEMRGRLVRAGAPDARVVVKRNSVTGEWTRGASRAGVVFVGRLCPEKGILRLAEVWPPDAPPLRIVGEGSDANAIAALGSPSVLSTGPLDAATVREVLACAAVTVMPSLLWEGLPLVLVESLAEDTPVVAFDSLAARDLVSRVDPALLVPAGDYEAFVAMALQAAVAPDRWRGRAREVFESECTDEVNVASLESAYETALSSCPEESPKAMGMR